MTGFVLAAPAQVPSPSIDYAAVAPVLVVLGVACVGVLVEAFVPRRWRWSVHVVLSLAAVVVAGGALAAFVDCCSGGRLEWMRMTTRPERYMCIEFNMSERIRM